MTAQPATLPATADGTDEARLPEMVRRAATALMSAETAAQVLEARDKAGVIYDAAKRAARMQKAKGAHDSIVASTHRAQADALEIESRAKRRLADEYDGAQDRGEVAKHSQGNPQILPDGKDLPATAAEVGITHKEIHEARIIRDAEVADPGIVKRTVDTLVADGAEPTRAAVRRAVTEAAPPRHATAPAPEPEPAPAPEPAGAEPAADNRPRIRLAEGETPESTARKGLAMEASGSTVNEIVAALVVDPATYRKMRDIVALADLADLPPRNARAAADALADMNSTGRAVKPWQAVAHIVARVWGGGFRVGATGERNAAKRREDFERAMGHMVECCRSSPHLDIPHLRPDRAKAALDDLAEADEGLAEFRKRLEEIYR